ncbi:MAG: reverse transcriptase family protein, partial [Betaproteobacteria bacterium]|nr:reverse transcriptase family protein [Betaproteobacteria bacterium]
MSYYITFMREARDQVTFEELLAGPVQERVYGGMRQTATWTYHVKEPRPELLARFALQGAINALTAFNQRHAALFEIPRRELYDSFPIPKKTGGLRQIDAPKDDLMLALRELKQIFERDCMALYHTSAYAYIPRRCTLDAVKCHQRNKSNWFCKLDFANFFGKTTPEFVIRMLTDIFPFSEILKREDGRRELTRALDLCFLTGTDPQNPQSQGLPQGTPISPMLTNLMMIPIDHALAKCFRQNNMVYTRYADDLLVTSRYAFSAGDVQQAVSNALEYFHAPFAIKPEKTRYGSRSGSNWNLGVILNQANEITIGWQNKKHFKAMLNNYIMDRRNGTPWPLED